MIPEEFKKSNIVGRTKSAGYVFGIRRTYNVTPARAWDYLVSPEGLKLWLGRSTDCRVEKGATYKLDNGTEGVFRVVVPNDRMRLAWKPQNWNKSSTIQIRLISSGEGRTTVAFHQENLADDCAREEMKEYWGKVVVVLDEKLI